MTDYFANVELSEASKRLYNSRLIVLSAIAKTNNFAALFKNPRSTVMMIRNHLKERESYTAQSLSAFIKSLMAYRKYHPEEFHKTETELITWRVLLRDVDGKANEYRMNGDPSPTQQLKEGIHLTMEKIEAVRDSLPDDDIRKLLIAFYTMIPPMRADYGDVRILPFNKEATQPNIMYMDKTKAVLSIGEHKMSAVLGPIRQVVPEQLRRLIQSSLSKNPRDHLFGPYSGTRFSVWANKQLSDVFGVSFTLTMFRHAYVNALPIETMTVDEKQKIAHRMGQVYNPNQQDMYRFV